MGPTRILLVIAASVVTALAVIALVLNLRDGSTTSATSISVGDCFAEFTQFEVEPGAPATAVESVDTADCDEIHALEAYYVGPAYESFENGYPDDETIDGVAITSCRQRFERFVGTDWESSELDFWWLTPSAAGWDQGDRDLVCLVGEHDKTLITGTLQDTGR